MVFVNMSVFPDKLEVRETLPKECFAYQDDMSPRIFTVYYIVFRIIIVRHFPAKGRLQEK